MSKRSCQNCLYANQCTSTRPCKYYLAIDDEDDEFLIEMGREQFYREWEAYMKDAEASDF